MTDCLRIRLRPTGPWRIAPDSGERDRAGIVFHSDALYSAVCSAMLRLGSLDEWLAATALHPVEPLVRFTSMFPWQGSHFFVPAPRGAWPPPPSSKLYGRAVRFLPQAVAAALFAGEPVQEDRWSVDGVSECLLPSGSRGPGSGPFRFALRTGAAVDRLEHGRSEVHQTACLEFAANAGLWFIVEFAGAAARSAWEPRVLTALRLLADSGFGGRRSIGWGHAEIVDVVSGSLPGLILGRPEKAERDEPKPELQEPAPEEPTGDMVAEAEVRAPSTIAPFALPPDPPGEPEPDGPPAPEPVAGEPTPPEPASTGEPIAAEAPPPPEPARVEEPIAAEATPPPHEPAQVEQPLATEQPPPPEPPPAAEPVVAEEPSQPPAGEPTAEEPPSEPPAGEPLAVEPPAPRPTVPPLPSPPPAPVPTAWWLLSLFTPGPADSIDWQRGAYTVLRRSGRVESPQGWGLPKKSLQLVAEGSMLFSPQRPGGAATDVSPDGFPHPVFRAGYAVAIPVPFRGTLP